LRFINVLGKLYTATSMAAGTTLCHMSEEDNIHGQRRDDVKYRKCVCFYNLARYFLWV